VEESRGEFAGSGGVGEEEGGYLDSAFVDAEDETREIGPDFEYMEDSCQEFGNSESCFVQRCENAPESRKKVRCVLCDEKTNNWFHASNVLDRCTIFMRRQLCVKSLATSVALKFFFAFSWRF
jgi:hypothetical protein